MKLWLLEPISNFAIWDTVQGFVVRAKTKERARELANNLRGTEGPVWLDPKLTACTRLTEDGEEEVILRDFYNG